MTFGSIEWYLMVSQTIAALHAELSMPVTLNTSTHMLWMAREDRADVLQLRAYLKSVSSPPVTPADPVTGDMIDLSKTQIVNSPDVKAWAATAAITKITITPNNVVSDFTKRDGPNRWPDQKPSWTAPGDTVQYTVWVFVLLNGVWVGAGFIQMWNGRNGVGDAPSDFVKNWYYPSRWDPMTGHYIVPNETIAFMVTAGDARNGGDVDALNVQERSNVVTLRAPVGDSGVFTF